MVRGSIELVTVLLWWFYESREGDCQVDYGEVMAWISKLMCCDFYVVLNWCRFFSGWRWRLGTRLESLLLHS